MNRRMFIGGQWKEGRSHQTLRSPHTGAVLAEVPLADREDVEEAISAAHQAAEAMRRLPAHRRADILRNVSAALRNGLEHAAEIISAEASKPLKAARAEVQRTIQTYEFAAEEARRITGHTVCMDAVPEGEGRTAYTTREPLGVIGAITPFNFPMNLVAHKVGPAIAAGNAIVLKPASQTPLSALYIAELFQQAGLPEGALNVITGEGRMAEQLVTDERVSMITFTGSVPVGKSICRNAGLKKVVMELGSNSALIIDEGVNVDHIVQRCVNAAFAYQGQVCISLQRVYVHDSLYESFVDKLILATKSLKLGEPGHASTDIAAMISQRETQRVLDWIEEAKRGGAQVRHGGRVVESRILEPTILTDAAPDLKVSCDEVFGPVLVVNAFSELDQAIADVNRSRFGLQAGVFTGRVSTVSECVRKLHVGGVIINDVPTYRVDHMPYGGVKESGLGREGVQYAVESMTSMKLIVQHHLPTSAIN